MSKQIKSIFKLYTYPLEIKWRLTELCNYSCSYCIRKDSTQKIQSEAIQEQNALILNTVPDVISIINNRKLKTKINLIGGEVSLLDLPSILKSLFSLQENNYISRISITTNFSRSINYYQTLITLCKKYNCEFTLTCSWHSEFMSLKEFIDKVIKLKKESEIRISCETVSRENNKDLVQEFINLCEQNNIIYKIDTDFNSKDKSNLVTKVSDLSKGGYRIIFDDNSEDHVKSLRLLLKQYGDDIAKHINTLDYFCSIDYDYICIRENNFLSSEGCMCKKLKPLKEYKTPLKFKKCVHPCSLCGSMSISKSEEDLLNYVQNKQFN